ncbi:hypothetical protein FOCC_FOCC002862 [Frankliniella occidentalis]|nr:hypothetical protein FOCC_FOCC002862 [Frankliniella occidentalis]
MAAIDPVLSRGVKLLLSNDPDAAEQLRSMLADALCNKYGAGVKLPPKVAIEEPSTDKKLFDSALKLNSPSPPAAAISDESSGSASADLDDSFSMNFTELSCVVCGQFNVGVRNQLMECSSCQQLYHQDCHSPPVKELSSSPWDCAECLKKKQPKEVKKEITSPVSGGKPASFASLGGSSNAPVLTSLRNPQVVIAAIVVVVVAAVANGIPPLPLHPPTSHQAIIKVAAADILSKQALDMYINEENVSKV